MWWRSRFSTKLRSRDANTSSAVESSDHLASVWVSRLVDTDANHTASRRWVERRLRAGGWLAGSDLLLVEVGAAVVRQSNDPADTRRIVARLASHPNLRWIPMDVSVRDHAARLAIDLRLHGADAVYVAVADWLGVPLVTWDREQLTRAGPAVQVTTP